MPLGKRWNLAEETILAKAYLAATQNPFKGADQTAIAFQNDLFEKFKSFSPENAKDGQYYHWTGMAILEELRSQTQGRCPVFQQGPEHSLGIKSNWCN
jgi:hypothetical protein